MHVNEVQSKEQNIAAGTQDCDKKTHYQSGLAGLPPQQARLEGARGVDGVLPGERGVLLGDRPLPEPGQRDLPLRLLALGRRARPFVAARHGEERSVSGRGGTSRRTVLSSGSSVVAVFRRTEVVGFTATRTADDGRRLEIFSSRVGGDRGCLRRSSLSGGAEGLERRPGGSGAASKGGQT